MDDKSFRSLLELDRLRAQASMAGSWSGPRHKRKRTLQIERFEEESSCKRFASAEEVTSHLQQLNLTNCIADKSYRNHSLYPPAFYDCAPQNKLSVSQPTRPPLSVMTISSCPGLLRGENVTGGDTKGSLGHVTEETCAERLINAPSRHMTNEGQRYTSEWVGQQNTLDVGQLISSHSPLKLVDDTSMSHSDNWNSMDRDVCPLVCPVKPEPDTGPPQMCLDSHMQYPNLDQFNYVPVSSDVKIRVMPPQLSNQIEDGANSLNKTLMSNPQDTITSDKLASSGLPRRENRQLSLLPDSQWIERQTEVVIDDVASDSSDGKVDSPERPLSVWISPELFDYSNSFQQKEYPLPQTLLDQYKSSVGMELIPWVDPETILLSGGEILKDPKNEEMDEEDIDGSRTKPCDNEAAMEV